MNLSPNGVIGNLHLPWGMGPEKEFWAWEAAEKAAQERAQRSARAQEPPETALGEQKKDTANRKQTLKRSNCVFEFTQRENETQYVYLDRRSFNSNNAAVPRGAQPGAEESHHSDDSDHSHLTPRGPSSCLKPKRSLRVFVLFLLLYILFNLVVRGGLEKISQEGAHHWAAQRKMQQGNQGYQSVFIQLWFYPIQHLFSAMQITPKVLCYCGLMPNSVIK